MLLWQSPCLTEASVSAALADVIRFGDTVFDVGSFAGSLSIVMGRLTGPRGSVISFEANPITAANAVRNFTENGSFNCHMINRAITETSGDFIKLHLSGGVGDSIFAQAWMRSSMGCTSKKLMLSAMLPASKTSSCITVPMRCR